MKRSIKQTRNARAPQTQFQLSPVAAGAALMVMVLGAHAQTTPSTQPAASADTQVITVTGIRQSIEAAISVKKNASAIVEALNSEDIGKMPDATVAESISRLPGVTMQRDKEGRAKNVSVRGMSPDFNGALLNGREMASTGDSRGVEFDQFPAELLSSVVIYKTPTANLTGQGLASTIDLRTVRPLDFGKRNVVLNARKVRTAVSSGGEEGDGDRRSFSYIDQFMDRKIGVAFGLAKSNDDGAMISNGGGNAWGRWEQELALGSSSVFAPAGFGEDVVQNKSERKGMMAVLQYKPNKDFETSVDFFRSKGKFGTKKSGLEGAISCQPPSKGGYNHPDWSCANFPYDPVTAIDTSKPYTVTTVDGKNFLEAGTVTGVKGVIRNHLEGGDDSLNAWGWNTRFRSGDWETTADIARSRVVRESDRFETTGGIAGRSTPAQVSTATWTGFKPGSAVFESTLDLGGIDYADRSVVKLTDVNGWSGGESFPQAGYNAHPKVTDTIQSGRVTTRRDNLNFGLVQSIEAGVNYVERDKVRTAPEGVLRILPGTDPYGAATIPGSGVTYLPTIGINIASFDPRGSVGTIYQRVDKVDKDILAKDWSVTEKVATGFVKGELDGTLFGLPVNGNVGVQFVQTNQSSAGFNVDSAACGSASTCVGSAFKLAGGDAAYLDVNPSLNLNFDLGRDQVLRFGLAKVMSRPNMADMRASLNYSVGTNGVSGDAGNPQLEPFRAKAIDLSYEKYFGTKGYISGAVFYKKLDSYIVKTSVPYDFSKYMTAAQLQTINPIGSLSMPVNGDGGNIRGIELTANVPFDMLTPVLKGFGVQASLSSTHSSITLPKDGFKVDNIDQANIPLPGLSKTVTNLRLYYENYGFQVSVGARKRSDFLGEISNFTDERSLTFIKGDTVVDLQVAYEFNWGPLKGLSLLFQGNNMTNSEFERYRDKPENTVEKIKYGKTYLFGANYKF